MENIQIKWLIDENGRKFLLANGVSTRIEINEENKEIKNIKAFFRELIYQCFLNGWDANIELIDDTENEIEEVKPLLVELINITNENFRA